MAGEAVQGVGVADPVENGSHQSERFLRDVDHPPRRSGFRRARTRVTRRQGFVGRCTHVDQEQRRDVSLFSSSGEIEAFRRVFAAPPIDVSVDQRVEIEVVSMLHSANFAELLGPHHANFASNLVDDILPRDIAELKNDRRRRRSRLRPNSTSDGGSRVLCGPTRRSGETTGTLRREPCSHRGRIAPRERLFELALGFAREFSEQIGDVESEGGGLAIRPLRDLEVDPTFEQRPNLVRCERDPPAVSCSPPSPSSTRSS